MKKVLVSENQKLFNALKSDISDHIPNISRVWDAYEALGIGEFDNDVWVELRDNGPDRIIEQYRAALQADLKATGVQNPVLRQVVLDGTDKPVDELRSALKALNQFRSIRHRDEGIWLTPDFISIVDGEIVITEDDQEQLKELYCRTYLETEDEIRFYRILERAIDVYKELAQFNKDMGKIWQTGFSFSAFDGFIFDKSTEPRISGEGLKRQVRWAKQNQ